VNHPKVGLDGPLKNRGFNQIKKFLQQITLKRLHDFSGKQILVLGALKYFTMHIG